MPASDLNRFNTTVWSHGNQQLDHALQVHSTRQVWTHRRGLNDDFARTHPLVYLPHRRWGEENSREQEARRDYDGES